MWKCKSAAFATSVWPRGPRLLGPGELAFISIPPSGQPGLRQFYGKRPTAVFEAFDPFDEAMHRLIALIATWSSSRVVSNLFANRIHDGLVFRLDCLADEGDDLLPFQSDAKRRSDGSRRLDSIARARFRS